MKKKQKQIVKSNPTTERLIQIRSARFKRDMEKAMADRGER
jgi:hypothetical protein